MNRHDLFIISSDNHEDSESNAQFALDSKTRYTIMTSNATETKHSSIRVVQMQLKILLWYSKPCVDYHRFFQWVQIASHVQ